MYYLKIYYQCENLVDSHVGPKLTLRRLGFDKEIYFDGG